MRKRYRILSVLAQFLFHYKKQFFESATFEQIKYITILFYFCLKGGGEPANIRAFGKETKHILTAAQSKAQSSRKRI